MFLRSLSMKGFKSFADPTVLEFEPGVTVVVGPNGSGKSNVVDAVTWVLGAQGPRALRSADDGRRHLRRQLVAPAARPGRGHAHHRQQLGQAPARHGRGDHHPDAVPLRRERVRDQRRALPAPRHPGAAERHRGRPPAAHDHRAGPARHGPQRPPRGPAGDHRGRRRRPQAPPAPRAGRAPARRHPGEPRAPGRPRARGPAADPPARAPGHRGPEPRRPGRRARPCCASTWPGWSWPSWPTGDARPAAALDALEGRGAGARRYAGRARPRRRRPPPPSSASRREEDLAAALGRVRALLERTRGTAQVLAGAAPLAGGRRSTPPPTSTSSPPSRPRRPGWPARWRRPSPSERGRDPELDGLARAEAELAADEQAHLAEWGDRRDVRGRRGGPRGDPGPGRGAAADRRAGPGRSAVARAAHRRARRPRRRAGRRRGVARRRPLGRSSARGPSWRRPARDAEATSLAPAQRRRGGRARARRPPSRSGTAPPPGPRRSARALARAAGLRRPRGARRRRGRGRRARRAGRDRPRLRGGLRGGRRRVDGGGRGRGAQRGQERPRPAPRATARPARCSRRRRGAPAAGTARPALPGDAEPLRPHVRTRRGSSGRSRRCSTRCSPRRSSCDGWERAIDLALDRPGARRRHGRGRPVRPERLAGPVLEPAGDRGRGRGRRRARGARGGGGRGVLGPAGAGPVRRSTPPGRHRSRRPGSSTGTWPRRRPPTPSGSRLDADRARLAAELDDVRRTQLEVAESAAAEAGVLADHEASLPVLEDALADARERSVRAEAGRRALEARRPGARRRAPAGRAGRGRTGRAGPGPGRRGWPRSSADWPATARSGRRLRSAGGGWRPTSSVIDRLAAVVARCAAGSRRSGRPRRRLPAPDGGGPRRRRAPRDAAPGPRRPPRRGSPRCATARGRSTTRRPRSTCGPSRSPRWSASSSARRPAEVIGVACPELPAGVSAGRARRGAVRPAGPARPDQPARPGGAERPRGASPRARVPDRRRAVGPPRAPRGRPHPRPRDRRDVRRRGRRRERALLDARRHAVPRGHRPARRSPSPRTCSTPGSTSRSGRPGATCGGSRCSRAASARSLRSPSSSRCSGAGRRPST